MTSFLDATRVLLDDEQYQRTQQLVRDFSEGEGTQCQAELEGFAEAECAEGRNWMSEMWLEAYLAGRTPVTLTSNVGFSLALTTDESLGDPIERAADLLVRCAATHLEHLRSETSEQLTPRGAPLCMQQWRYLAGGARHPPADIDGFLPGPTGAANRSVLVLWKGNAATVAISDAHGQPLSRAAVGAALREITALAPVDGLGFADMSFLGGEQLAPHLAQLCCDELNAATYRAVTEAVFGFTLDDRPADEDEHLRRSVFQVGMAWAYKPSTFLVSLADDFVGMHVEHTIVDGGTLKTSIERAQQLVADTTATEQVARWQQLAWAWPEALEEQVADQIDQVRHAAASHRVRTHRVPTLPQAEIGIRMSHDAGIQFVLLYAQLATYGRVRSTYEAVDMREYQAGRTECLRPNTIAAVALATAMRDGDATVEHLHAALAAHRAGVIACKTGQAFDRHLFALRSVARKLGHNPQLFAGEGYRALTSDLLSTTSLGDQAQIVRYAFAPAITGGIGVDYNAFDGEYEFCLSVDDATVERLDEFVANLHEGARRLFEVVVSAGRAA
ncbi:choline/carnitine O-acyltransferase [Luteococcus japonicus]|uniref:choline/carnitine O-acyltransferase n=1 Tax=Luteococcus japonicus TaxID=33984 RepID=UPI000B9BD980|nr:choline/carnitine O-acyltransferase [Luteococcus japonicus]